VLQTVRAVQEDMGLAPITALPEIFPANECYPLVYPECDPYRQARTQPAVGPLEPPETGPLSEPNGPLFAYLTAGYPGFGALLNGLEAHRIAADLFVRDATADLLKKIRAAGFNLYDRPPPLAQVLAKSSAFLHHGGVGSAMEALAAGRPQICLPTHLEQRLTGDALQAIGVSVSLPGKPEMGQVLRAIQGVLQTPKFAARAMAVAKDVRGRGYGDNRQRIVDHCCTLMGASWRSS
jgi:UDP:flavonoid glycosyltransferase YjiC (YdhE family)